LLGYGKTKKRDGKAVREKRGEEIKNAKWTIKREKQIIVHIIFEESRVIYGSA
jgi:ribosomal silencing factor RsfS